jgi:hypothetical protein
MNTTEKLLGTTKRIRMSVLAAALLVSGTTMGLATASASAYSCHVFTATTVAATTSGMAYSKTYRVPNASESSCKDINIRNVQNQQVPSDHCATFRVQFFPTWGKPYYGKAKTVCSNGAKGAIVPIATNVLSGTKYRVWHNIEGQALTHTYQIVD